MSSPDIFAAYDDMSPAFHYDDPTLWGHLDNAPQALNYTVSYTSAAANVTITFAGSSALLSGVIGDSSLYGNPSINVYLDGHLDNWGTAPTVTTHIYDQTFYSTGTIPNGDHTIIIENKINGTILFIDALYFIPSGSMTGSPTLVTVTSTQPVVATGKSTSLVAGNISHTSSMNKATIGAIVGGAVGAVVLLVAITFVVFRFCRSRRHGANPYQYNQVTDPVDSGSIRELKLELPEIVSRREASLQSQLSRASSRASLLSPQVDRSFTPPAPPNGPRLMSPPSSATRISFGYPRRSYTAQMLPPDSMSLNTLGLLHLSRSSPIDVPETPISFLSSELHNSPQTDEAPPGYSG